MASHVQDLASNLKCRGVRVRILGYGEFGWVPGVRKVSVTRRGWWRTRFWLGLTLRQDGILHDHTGMLPYPDPALLRELDRLIRRRRSHWVLTLHDETLLTRFHCWPREMRDFFDEYVRQPDQLICVGKRLEEFVMRRGVPAGRVTNIPPLLPLAAGFSAPLPTADTRFLAARVPTICAVGAFDANYDLPTLVRAFPSILRPHPRAGLLIIDPGFTRDPVVVQEVRQGLDDLPAGSYRLLSCVSRDRVRALLGASAVLVRGTRLESYGLSRAEALLGGTPVVTTPSGETCHMRLYDYGNAEHLAREVLTVLASPPDLGEARGYYAEVAQQAMERVWDVYERVG
ncbi:MAG TPA: glycosyltransferase family 4 protein [Candidatus Methylomirabilis sp.]|nr:glycosyltransferase family 4 protein [Candidatus Methylomirabilis sp.]